MTGLPLLNSPSPTKPTAAVLAPGLPPGPSAVLSVEANTPPPQPQGLTQPSQARQWQQQGQWWGAGALAFITLASAARHHHLSHQAAQHLSAANIVAMADKGLQATELNTLLRHILPEHFVSPKHNLLSMGLSLSKLAQTPTLGAKLKIMSTSVNMAWQGLQLLPYVPRVVYKAIGAYLISPQFLKDCFNTKDKHKVLRSLLCYMGVPVKKALQQYAELVKNEKFEALKSFGPLHSLALMSKEVALSMQSDVVPTPFRLIKGRLHGAITAHNQQFPNNPLNPKTLKHLATASVKEVYTALDSRGNKVVVAARRPDADPEYYSDSVRMLFAGVCKASDKQTLRLAGCNNVLNMVRLLVNEANPVHEKEATNTLKTIAKAAGLKGDVPQILSHTADGMTMEYVEGSGLNKVKDAQTKHDLTVKALLDLSLLQVSRGFHGDPHAGNALVTPQGGIVWLDAGISGIAKDFSGFANLQKVMLAGGSEAQQRAALDALLTPQGQRLVPESTKKKVLTACAHNPLWVPLHVLSNAKLAQHLKPQCKEGLQFNKQALRRAHTLLSKSVQSHQKNAAELRKAYGSTAAEQQVLRTTAQAAWKTLNSHKGFASKLALSTQEEKQAIDTLAYLLQQRVGSPYGKSTFKPALTANPKAFAYLHQNRLVASA